MRRKKNNVYIKCLCVFFQEESFGFIILSKGLRTSKKVKSTLGCKEDGWKGSLHTERELYAGVLGSAFKKYIFKEKRKVNSGDPQCGYYWGLICSNRKLWNWCGSSSVQFSPSVASNSLRTHGLQYARFPSQKPTSRASSNSHVLSQWCHATILSSVVLFFSCLNLSQHQGLSHWASSSRQVAKALELQHQSFQWMVVVVVQLLSRIWLLWSHGLGTYQAPQSMGFSRQEYWRERMNI